MKITASKIKYHSMLLYRKLVFLIGWDSLLLKNNYGERILVFHNLDAVGETKYNSRFISATYFEALISYMKTHFNLISLDDYYAGKFKNDTLNIAITFDDGLQNNCELAVPILQKYQVPASFFITAIHEHYEFLWPDFVDLVSYYSPKKAIDFDGRKFIRNGNKEFTSGSVTLKNYCKQLEFGQIEPLFAIFKPEWEEIKKKDLDCYWKLMNENQIREIAENPLFTIGSHAKTHAGLASVSIENAKNELLESKQQLEKITNRKLTSFAFPFGDYNAELIGYCTDLGYSQQLLVDYNCNSDKENKRLRNRFGINPYIGFKHQISCLLKGSYL